MVLLLGFQRALTFQKFQSSSNYVPDEEIKECTQIHIIDYYRNKYDNVNLHVNLHLSQDDDMLNVYKDTCIA